MTIKRLRGTALKMLDNERVGGYLVVWGSAEARDLQGEYFTPETELGLDYYDNRPLLYQHGLDDTLGTLKIGTIHSLKKDDIGVWMEAQLDMRQEYARAVARLVEQGALGLSSGTLPHWVTVDEDGHIRRWIIVEGSATPTPAEPRTNLDVMKALTELDSFLGTDHKALDDPDSREDEAPEDDARKGDEPGEDEVPVDDDPDSTLSSKSPEGGATMTPEMINALIAALVAAGASISEEQAAAAAQQLMAEVSAQSADEPMFTEDELLEAKAYLANPVGNAPQSVSKALRELSRIVRGMNQSPGLMAAAKAAANVPQSRAGGSYQTQSPAASNLGLNVRVGSKFDGATALDLAYTYKVLRAAGLPVRVEFFKALQDKLQREKLPVTASAVKSLSGLKDNELNHSTQADYGDEWVPELWDSSLWERLRVDNAIAASLNWIDMPSDPFNVPAEGTDPTVYLVPETTNEAQLLLDGAGNPTPDSKIGSAKVQLDAKKLGLRVGMSEELVEDSIINVAAQYQAQARRAIEDAIDNVLLNGDSDATASTNINLIDGTPAATAKYLVFNGLRKLPLVTNTANAVDAGATSVTLTAIRATRFKLAAAYALRPDNLRLVCGAETYATLLRMPEFLTMDKAGVNATAQTGQVGFVDGIPVIVSSEFALANAAGKIPAAGGTLGSLVIYAPYAWKAGYRRRVKLSLEYISYYDAWVMTANTRIALNRIDTDCSAILYNLAV